MESAFIFLPLPSFLYSPDDHLIPILSILRPLRRSVPPSISDVIHLTQFLITSRAHNLTAGAAAIVNPVPLIITLTAPPPSISCLDSLPIRHNSFIPLASVGSDPFTIAHPNITFSLQGSAFPIHLSVTLALSSFVSGYLSPVDH